MRRGLGALWIWLRWLLVAPLGAGGFWVALAVGLTLFGWAFRLCPPEDVVSGLCGAAWFEAATVFAGCVGAAVGAAWTVALPAWVAPRGRARVAWLMYALGALFSVGFVLEPFVRRPQHRLSDVPTLVWASALVALGVGAAVAASLSRRWGR